MDVVDLFCGIGGFSLGATSIGFNVVAGFDYDSKSLTTWNTNFDSESYEVNLVEEDVTEYVDDVDCVVASPPCKSVSVANRTNSSNKSPIPRTGELINQLNPSFFIFENVPNLEWNYEQQLEEMKNHLDEYEMNARLLNAAWYGVPQHSIRYILIGVRKDKLQDDTVNFPAPTHGEHGDKKLVTSKKSLEDAENPNNADKYEPNDEYKSLLEDIPPSLNYSFYTEKRGHPNPRFEWRAHFSDFLRKAHPNEPCVTVKSEVGGGNGPYHWDNRRFTEDELKRIQSFPSSFKIPYQYYEARRQIGKAVPPLLAQTTLLYVYLQTTESPALLNCETELNPISSKRTSAEKLQRRAERRFEELEE